MPTVRPTLLPAKKVPTAKARFFLSKVSRMTREPDGIIADSPIPSSVRNAASGAKAWVRLHSTVASDHVPTPSGYERCGRIRSVIGPAASREKVKAQLNADISVPTCEGV